MPFKAAKRYLRRLRLKRLGVCEQVKIARLPLAYDQGAWMIHPDPITRDSIIYSFGVGSNIAWDLAMIERFGVTVHAFDPTPRAREWLRTFVRPPQFVFHEYGVGKFDGEIAFYPPRRRTSYNFSPIDRGYQRDADDVALGPVKRLSTIMRELRHDHIDILKMDIEGGEYEVIEDLLQSDIEVGQVLVEFHHNFRGVPITRTTEAIRALNARGYRIFHLSPRGYELSLINGLHG